MTWDKCVYELIDYDSDELLFSKIEIKEPGHIYRQFNAVKFYKKKLIDNPENEHLFSISCNKEQFFLNLNSFQIDENENICSNNSPWFSLKKSKKNKKMNNFKISEGDVIKIGKLEFEKQLIEKKLKTLSEKQSRCEERLSEKKDENQKLISDNQRLFSIKTNLERELYDKNEVIRMLKS